MSLGVGRFATRMRTKPLKLGQGTVVGQPVHRRSSVRAHPDRSEMLVEFACDVDKHFDKDER